MPILYPGTWPTTQPVTAEEIEEAIVSVLQGSTYLGVGGVLAVKYIARLPELPDGALPSLNSAQVPAIFVRCGDATSEYVATATARMVREVEIYVVTRGLQGRAAEAGRQNLRTDNLAIRDQAVEEIRNLDGTTTLMADLRQLFIEGSGELSKVLVTKDNPSTAVSSARVRVYTFRGIEQ